MSVRYLSDLIVTIMAAGEVSSLPVRDQGCLHQALADLETIAGKPVEQLWSRFGGRRRWRIDPGAGTRADGVTTALWDAVESRALDVVEAGRSAHYILAAAGRQHGRQVLMRLPAAEAELVYEVGARWASASTARKKPASALASSA